MFGDVQIDWALAGILIPTDATGALFWERTEWGELLFFATVCGGSSPERRECRGSPPPSSIAPSDSMSCTRPRPTSGPGTSAPSAGAARARVEVRRRGGRR
jgi:hypothetical protein